MSKTPNVQDRIIAYIKQFKKNNDKMLQYFHQGKHAEIKAIVQHQDANISQYDQIINKLQESYLDPESARKVQMLRQQFKIQRERYQGIKMKVVDGQKDNHGSKSSGTVDGYPRYQGQSTVMESE